MGGRGGLPPESQRENKTERRRDAKNRVRRLLSEKGVGVASSQVLERRTGWGRREKKRLMQTGEESDVSARASERKLPRRRNRLLAEMVEGGA